MLEKVRKPRRAKNFIAYVVFGAICLVFVFMGDIPGGGGLTPGGPAAIVNKEPILFSDYREAYSRMQEQFGGRFDALPAAQRQMDVEEIRKKALEQLINSRVISQAALGLGIYSSDEEIRNFIMDIPAFQEDERFRRERYDNYLDYRKITAEKFEQDIRKDVANKQVLKLFEMSLTPSQVALDLDQKLEQYKLNLSFVRFTDDQIKNALKVEARAVEDYLAKNENEQALNDYYTANKNKYQEKEQVKARHILVKFNADKPEEIEQAYDKIVDIKKRTETEDFAKLAEKLSDDSGSKSKGGDLGFFTRGRMVPEFENVAFTQELNKISDPVKSPFGYHLIKVEEKKDAVTKDIEEVKADIAKELIKEQELKEVKEKIDQWLKRESEKELNAWLKKNQLSWQESGEFNLASRYLPKLSTFGEEEIKKLIKSANANDKLMNEMISLNDQNYLIKFLTFKKEEPESKKDFEASVDRARDQIVNDVFENWLVQRK